jgi:3-keto-disaccharide hydrolase
MPTLQALLVAIAALLVAQAPAAHTFDEDATGQPPPGFTLSAERNASPGRWTVERDGGSRVLAHAGSPAGAGGFGFAIYSGERFDNAEISVRIKATGGSRTGGLVWRYQDALNYYAVQLNLAGQELSVYRVVRGNRIRLEREDDLELDPDAWHSLRVVQDGESLRVYLGGIRVFGDRDRSPREPGGVGLWASGDAMVSFDDFRAGVRTERRR